MAKLFLNFGISTAFLTLAAAAQTATQWDLNDDGVVNEAELRQTFSEGGAFERWDANGDAAVSFDEFAPAVYGLWDANDDGSLSVDEWDRAVDLWFGESGADLSVEAWDGDGNGVISLEEFTTSTGAADLFARLEDDDDADELLSEDELASGIFGVADVDQDAFLDEEEDWFLVDLLELFNAPDEQAIVDGANGAAAGIDEEAERTDQPEEPVIERGEQFVQLPIPCGEGQADACRTTAQRFCEVLGYGQPIDVLDVGGRIYALRCSDDL